MRANISAPTVIDVVFELPLINKVEAFPAETLQSPVLVDLSESALAVILADSQVAVDWAMVWGVSHDVLGVEHTKLLPSLNTFSKRLAIM